MKTISWRYGATFSLLVVSLLASRIADWRRPGALASPLSDIPRELGGWVGTDDPPPSTRVLKSLSATSYLSRTYRRPSLSEGINVFVAYYANPRAGEAMHSPKHCLPGGGWEPIETGTVEVSTGGKAVQVNKYRIYNSGARSLLLYWYQSSTRITASEYTSKIYLVWDRLLMRSPSSSLVRLTLPDQPGAMQAAMTFATEIIPRLRQCLGECCK